MGRYEKAFDRGRSIARKDAWTNTAIRGGIGLIGGYLQGRAAQGRRDRQSEAVLGFLQSRQPGQWDDAQAAALAKESPETLWNWVEADRQATADAATAERKYEHEFDLKQFVNLNARNANLLEHQQALDLQDERHQQALDLEGTKQRFGILKSAIGGVAGFGKDIATKGYEEILQRTRPSERAKTKYYEEGANLRKRSPGVGMSGSATPPSEDEVKSLSKLIKMSETDTRLLMTNSGARIAIGAVLKNRLESGGQGAEAAQWIVKEIIKAKLSNPFLVDTLPIDPETGEPVLDVESLMTPEQKALLFGEEGVVDPAADPGMTGDRGF